MNKIKQSYYLENVGLTCTDPAARIVHNTNTPTLPNRSSTFRLVYC